MHRLAVDLGEILLFDPRKGMIGEMLLGGLGGAMDARHRPRIAAHVRLVLDLQVIEHALDDIVVEVVAAEVVVAVAGDHLDHALLNAHDRDVEGPAAEIVDEHPFALLLRRLVDEGRRGRLVDDAGHLEPGDLAGFAGRLPLRVGKERRDRDHRLPHRLAKPNLGDHLQAAQDHR